MFLLFKISKFKGFKIGYRILLYFIEILKTDLCSAIYSPVGRPQ